MALCPSCGRENPDDARFCNACGSELAPSPSREVRKIVTVLFADVVGSTKLGETTDPEALRARMRSYFDDLRQIVERHGGRVEKFIGDAVMAVFGVPVAHEDDALRAVRAAAEMRHAVARHGLEARIGVNTGEVVAGGDAETLVTGDAVNVAARLEQAAPPGEVLLGGQTLQLVRDAVRAEAVEPLTLKGKSAPVVAYRLLEISSDADAVARHPHAPLVGRRRERERLRRDFDDVVAERTCRLFTLLGPAGIGKSRLVADFLSSLDASVDVLRGRCLHYGEGITYWPLVEILVRLGVDPETIIGTSPEETRLAFRRFLETRASERPQVVVLDDLQWAEPTFLDLVEHVADFTRDAPVFLLCIARTELLELRPGWGGGKLNATSVLLEPLDRGECETLIDNLVGAVAVTEDMRARITRASEGNPLFVEEMLALVRESGGHGDVAIPPTIQALLQARLDMLEADERLVIERGSVEGEVFHRGAVAELAPPPVRPSLEAHLQKLVRKELIRSVSSTFENDEGFRFRHLLIRDAAYESLPKATRAELHERFADWLARHDLVEGDEIVGYHVERAHRFRSELDPDDPRLPALASRAATHLGDAGVGAMDRGDWAAARSLLRRARELLSPGSDARAALGPNLAIALQETGEIEEALQVATEAAQATDPVVRARGMLAEAELHAFEAAQDAEDARTRAEEARGVLEAAGDAFGVALYWRLRGYLSWARCRTEDARDAWERALAYARAADAERIEDELETVILSTLVQGPTPVAEVLPHAQHVLASSRDGSIRQAAALRGVATLRSFDGGIEEARELHARGREIVESAGLLVSTAAWSMTASAIERRAGDREAEERLLREGYEALSDLRDRYFLSTVALYLADAVANRTIEADAEVDALCVVARERTISGDLVNFVGLDSIEARMLARRGRLPEALTLAGRAVASADDTDMFDFRGKVRLGLAEVLAIANAPDDAARVAAEAVAIYDAKGDVTGRMWAERRLGEIAVATA